MANETIVRFWEKVDTSDRGGCWLWAGAHNWAGYGLFYEGGRALRAHRFAYEHLAGPIAEGLQVDHLCRIPACVRPDHLEPVTPRENTLRGIGPTAIHARKTHCRRRHEFTPENTYERPDGRRECRTCAEDNRRRYRARLDDDRTDEP